MLFQRTSDSFQQGSRTLPGEYYTSPTVLGHDRERIFARLWNCAGRASALSEPGDFVARDVAGESLLIVRGDDRRLRAFFNVCRHRGTRLCGDERGRLEGTLQCPYHAWTYALDGRLVGAPHMQEVAGFERGNYPLHEAAAAEWGGFIFVSIAERAVPFEEWIAPLESRLARFGLAQLEVRHRAAYDVRANWKLVFQNYSECLHCPVIHPGLAARIPYQSGANDLTEGPFLGGLMELTAGDASVTGSGRACAPLISEQLTDADRRRAYYYSVLPNMMLSVHPDYALCYLVTPLAVDRTRVDSEWLFAPGPNTVGDDSDAVTFWDQVNRQDWDIIERSQLGISSRRYEPGPYSPRESISAAWDREYLTRIGAFSSEDP
jgi:Rieske 2Fe-2S family protein